MNNSTLRRFALILATALTVATHAQEEGQSASDIARELANPNTALGTMAFPLDFVWYQGELPQADEQSGTVLNFQPSLPIPLSTEKGMNLFIRPLIPIYLSQPYFGENGFEQKGVALGNISADVAMGKTFPSKTIAIAGVFGSFRTASDEALRSPVNVMGPEFMVAQLFNWGVAGLLVNQAWSISDPANGTANITGGQYFLTVNLKNAWQISGQPTWSYNHDGSANNKLTLPVGSGLSKTFKMGRTPIKMSLQYWYYVATPELYGPLHQVRFQIAPVVKLPW